MYAFYILKILGLSDGFITNRTIPIDTTELQYNVRDLSPGASYQVQAFTIFDNRESLAYTSRNFTTSKFEFYSMFKHILNKRKKHTQIFHQIENKNNHQTGIYSDLSK